MYSPLEQFDLIPIFSFSYGNVDLTFFNIFLPLLLILSLFFFLKSYSSYYKLIPSHIQHIFESIVEFIFGIIKNQIGKEGFIYLPFIFTIFTFVLFANLLSVIPFGIALTSHLIVTLWLSLTICSSIFILGLFYNNLKFLKIFIPKCPIALLPVSIIIELFSYIIRAFSMSIRLTANILAGHTLVNIISVFIVNTLAINLLFSFIGFLGLFAILLLEIGVACLQAYVITILTCIYLKDVFHIDH
jgi:ATP synthase subunit 6